MLQKSMRVIMIFENIWVSFILMVYELCYDIRRHLGIFHLGIFGYLSLELYDEKITGWNTF